jgi:hypothetical protein
VNNSWPPFSPSPMYIHPSPSWILQQCPRCEGDAYFVVHGEEDGAIECPFCWGVGVVKVSYFSGAVEAIEPPAEPYWHQEHRKQAIEQPAGPGSAGVGEP